MMPLASGPVPVTAGWRLVAVGAGLAVLIGMLVVIKVATPAGTPKRGVLATLVEGADGVLSTSKFQWFVWLLAIAFAYVTLWVLRAGSGDYSAISQVPANLLLVLGFSSATMAGAKGITVGYLRSGQVTKAAPAAGGSAAGGILTDDDGVPELAKIQMIAFTLIGVGIFLATVIHQVVQNPPLVGLPDIDSSLLVLMGISQGTYLGKKLVSTSVPKLYSLTPTAVHASGTVTLSGDSLGAVQAGQICFNGQPIALTATAWSDGSIQFIVPATNPLGGSWAGSQVVQVAIAVGGQMSNSLPLAVIFP